MVGANACDKLAVFIHLGYPCRTEADETPMNIDSEKEVIDVSGDGPEDVVNTIGAAALAALSYAGVAVMVRSPSGNITLLHPRIFAEIPDEALAGELLTCWDEADVEAFFAAKFSGAKTE